MRLIADRRGDLLLYYIRRCEMRQGRNGVLRTVEVHYQLDHLKAHDLVHSIRDRVSYNWI